MDSERGGEQPHHLVNRLSIRNFNKPDRLASLQLTKIHSLLSAPAVLTQKSNDRMDISKAVGEMHGVGA